MIGSNPYFSHLCSKISYQFCQDSIELTTKTLTFHVKVCSATFCSQKKTPASFQNLHVSHQELSSEAPPHSATSLWSTSLTFPWNSPVGKMAVRKKGKRIYYPQHTPEGIWDSAILPHIPIFSWQSLHAGVCKTAATCHHLPTTRVHFIITLKLPV